MVRYQPCKVELYVCPWACYNTFISSSTRHCILVYATTLVRYRFGAWVVVEVVVWMLEEVFSFEPLYKRIDCQTPL